MLPRPHRLQTLGTGQRGLECGAPDTVPALLVREQNLSLKEQMGHEVRALVALDGSAFAEVVLLPAVPPEREGFLMSLSTLSVPSRWRPALLVRRRDHCCLSAS